MLKTLQIKDYALIENIEVEFGKGLNIITGETGAGKSILIDAMGLLLGERASTEVVRKGSAKSVVEGIFDITGNKKVKKLLEINDIDCDSELIVRREVSVKGSNRCFLNDTPVTLNLIKEAGDLLVDLHGQHEHQSLLRTETHIEMLDEFSGTEKLIAEYSGSYSKMIDLIKEKKDLSAKEHLLREKKEIYEFQIKEIDAVSPQPGEEEQLQNELKILENSEKLLELTNEIYSSLYDDEDSVYDRLVSVRNKITDLSGIDKQFAEKEGECESALTLLNDISSFIRSYKERIYLEPERLEEVRERLGALNLLKKKYGGSLAAVIQHREKIGKEFEIAENFSGKLASIDNEIKKLRITAGTAAKKISAERKTAAKKIKKEIESVLKDLGIADSVFETKFFPVTVQTDSENFILIDEKKTGASDSGADKIEFYISTNPGEDAKPLVKVASGGEVSRIMLALKTVLAKTDRLPILIFDEIDTGVSGRIAQKVGQSLKSLASFHQIVAITHLPQIAGFSDYHFTVEKKKTGERVVSTIRTLEAEEKVREVAKLMSGENITEAALKGARELMGIN